MSRVEVLDLEELFNEHDPIPDKTVVSHALHIKIPTLYFTT